MQICLSDESIRAKTLQVFEHLDPNLDPDINVEQQAIRVNRRSNLSKYDLDSH